MNSVRVGDIGTTITGKTPSTKYSEYFDGDIMFVTPVDLKQNYYINKSERYITSAGLDSIKKNSISGKSVLVGCIGSDLGNIAMVDEECATNQQINSITNFKSEYSPEYVYYWFTTKKAWLHSIAGNTTTPIINKTDFNNINIQFPSRAEQDRVVSVLSAIDEKISTNNTIIETSEKLMREIYDYWLVQFDFPDENGRPYKSSGGEMVYNETLKREIPKGWSVKRVDELCEVKTGKEDANFSVPDGDYKFFTCADEPLRCNTPCFSGKSILIAGNGNFNVKHYDGNFNAYQRTYVLQPDDEFYGITFIEAKNKTELFTKGSNGSIVKFITKGDVGSIYVLTSPRAMELYETFNTILAEIDVVQSENEKLASLRDWLLPMLMNGQVKITGDS